MADLSLNITATTASAQQSVESLAQSIRELTAGVKRSTKEIGKMGEGTRTASAHLLSIGRSANKTAGFFEKFGKSLGRIAFYRAIRSAIRYVTSAFKEGLEAAYNWSKLHPEHAKLAGSMDRLREAAGKMKLQLGAAFGGLIVAIEPILIKIINLVTAAANAITQFFAILNGTGWYKKAVSGLTETANAAGGAGKKIKGLLASWDELTVIGKETGGGGGSGTNDGDGGYVWEQVDSEILDLINNGKFFELGANLAEQLNLGIQSWDAAGTARWISEKLGNLLDFVNGFIINFDFVALGEKLYEFVTNVEWDELASKLYEGLGAALGGIGQFLFGIVKSGVKDAFDSFMSASFDGNGDFNFSGFWEWLTNAIKKGAKLTNPLLLIWEDILPDFVSGFISSVTNGGIDGGALINSISKWIEDNIYAPIRKWFSDHVINIDFDLQLPDLQSLSTIWKNLKGGTKTFTAKVAGVKETVLSKIADAWNKITGKEETLTTNVDPEDSASIIGAVSKVWNEIKAGTKGLKATYSGVKEAVITKIEKAWNALFDKDIGLTAAIPTGLPDILTPIKDAWTAIKAGTKNLTLNRNGSATETVLNKIKGAWDSIYTKTSELTANLVKQNGLDTALDTLKSAWVAIETKKAKFTAELSASQLIRNFIAEWNKLGNKTLELKAVLTEKVRDAWNKVARAWNNTSLLSALGTLPTFAQGGFPEEGQLFIAREAGPELVGSMNGKTAVANNDQIVAGITSGVKAAQSEQNALLKQQNAILIELLKKEFVLSPSVGLGQVVSRSATLYGRAN